MYIKAYDFVIAIAEPVRQPFTACKKSFHVTNSMSNQVNRAHYIHEYRISTYSLYAAVSLGLDTESIVTTLDRLSKAMHIACLALTLPEVVVAGSCG